MSNDTKANYMIMFLRFLASSYLKQNDILYQEFTGEPMETYCPREVEQVDVEADHIPIIALTNYMEQGVEINGVSEQQRVDVTLIPEDGFPSNDFRVKVLFVPGHYDALYQWL